MTSTNNIAKSRNNKVFSPVLLLYYTLVSWGFAYSNFRGKFIDYCVYGICFLIFLYFLGVFSQIKRAHIPLLNYVTCLIILPLITLFIKQQISPEEINPEMEATVMWAMSGGLFCYYYKKNFSELKLINTLTSIALIILVIQIIQNLFPDQALFGKYQQDIYNQYGELQIASERNGILTFKIGTEKIALLCLFFYWNKITKKITTKNLVLFLCFVTAIYLTMTRQLIAVVAFTLIYSFSRSLRSNKIVAQLLFGAVSIGLIVYFWNELFGNLIGMFKEDSYTLDIRGVAIPFFLNSSTDNLLQFIFGHGGITSREQIWSQSGLYVSDVGFVGELYRYGIIWILLYFGFLIYAFKNRKSTPSYINLYIVCTALDSIFIFPYRNVQEIFVWIICLYIMSRHLKETNINWKYHHI